MVQYYMEKQGEKVLNPALLNEEAHSVAQDFVSKKGTALTSAQLRRFYGEAKNLEKKATDKERNEITEESFAPVLPLVKMLKSKVAYAANPANPKVPEDFKKWLDKHLDSVNSAEEFKAFLLHFEAVVGFCYGLGMKNT